MQMFDAGGARFAIGRGSAEEARNASLSNRRLNRWRMTLTWLMTASSRHNRAVVSSRLPLWWHPGFSTAETAPAWSASIAELTSSGFTVRETMTIGVGRVSMIRRVASRPLMRGSWISMEMTLGATRGRIAKACSAVSHAATTVRRGSPSIASQRNLRTVGESSTIMTRILPITCDILAYISCRTVFSNSW